MKKLSIALLALLMAVLAVSCTTTEYVEVEVPVEKIVEKTVEVDKSVVEVGTFNDLVKALTNVKDGQTIKLTADITWGKSLYSDNCAVTSAAAKGWIFDLNGKTISNYTTSALALLGDFTMKNGKIIGDAQLGMNGAIILVNSNGYTSGVDYGRTTKENWNVVIDGITTENCGIRVERSSCVIVNCDLQNAGTNWAGMTVQSTGCYMVIMRSKLTQLEPDTDGNYTMLNCFYSNGYSVNYIAADVVLEGNKRVYAHKNSITYIDPSVETSPNLGTATYLLPVYPMW